MSQGFTVAGVFSAMEVAGSGLTEAEVERIYAGSVADL